jgi:predicted RNA binding protein YcfA (HicA-like mRNA interferase family)
MIGLMPTKVRGDSFAGGARNGWVEMRSEGSHRHFKHPDQACVITLPGNDGKELAPGTLNAIVKKAELKR